MKEQTHQSQLLNGVLLSVSVDCTVEVEDDLYFNAFYTMYWLVKHYLANKRVITASPCFLNTLIMRFRQGDKLFSSLFQLFTKKLIELGPNVSVMQAATVV